MPLFAVAAGLLAALVPCGAQPSAMLRGMTVCFFRRALLGIVIVAGVGD